VHYVLARAVRARRAPNWQRS